ncbi:Enamidase [Moorella humiferrea]|uniref:amidohydrolase family protein n=1 Tax=Neomoorella humiferrea TaxID=676965 RepID=UPI0030CEDCA0
MSMVVIKNIGTIVSGDINQPLLEGNTILIKDGLIAAVGGEDILQGVSPEVTIDAGGMTVTPGLIDSHVHPVLGDYTPRQKTADYISGSLHGGVTTMISAGECHTPGRPKDPAGTKALAVLAHKSFANARPGGVKVHGGALILEPGLTEADFAELAAAGVWLVGEIGLGGVKTAEQAAPMVEWAHKYGFKVAMHTGGTSIPGSSTVTAAQVMATKPDVVSHLNGGPTAIPEEEVIKIIDETDFAVEMVQCGNFRIADLMAKRLKERNELHRLIMGNDSPSGSGIIPLGILRNIAFLASVSGIPAAEAVAAATGNTARVYGLNTGVIAPGKEADLVLMDAPMGSVGRDALGALAAGDLPGVALVLVDGEIKVEKSRNTPPATRKVSIKK